MRRSRKREWFAIIALAVMAHLALLLWVRPSFFSVFRRPGPGVQTSAGPRGVLPDAIIVIPVDDELPAEEPSEPPVETTAIATEPAAKRSTPPKSAPVGRPDEGLGQDVENLIGQSPQPLPGSNTRTGVVVPPRPVEITWPDTRKLKHCLGHLIDVRIHVAEDGRILQVEPAGGDHPADCVEAALASARQIVFAPGQVDGKPTDMWTNVRIDFRRRR